MLAGVTAGTLIGLIFVVIAFGMDHAGEGQKRGAATRSGCHASSSLVGREALIVPRAEKCVALA
jgi:hypothetical protein